MDNFRVADKSNKLSFKDYVESKKQLRNAAADCPKYFCLYEVNKYCKLPLLENDNSSEEEKVYIAFKPKDKIKIFWEAFNLDAPTAHYILIISENIEKKYYFNWNNEKITKWLNSTTYRK